MMPELDQHEQDSVNDLRWRVFHLEQWKERMDYRATRILIIGIGAGFAFVGTIVSGLLLGGLGIS